MPQSLSTLDWQSSESFRALLIALGFWEPDIPPTYTDAKGSSVDPLTSKTTGFPQMNSSYTAMQRPTTPYSDSDSDSDSDSLLTDEAFLFGQEFLSDFEICSDEESEDTLPSRPGSSLESFELSIEPTIRLHHDQQPHVQQKPSLIYKPPPIICQKPPISHYQPRPTHLNLPSKTTVITRIPSSLDPIYVKVAHNASIIMIRIPRDISFSDLKRRIYDKFMHQENLPLSQTFSVVLAVPPRTSHIGGGSKTPPLETCTEMRFIDHEADWRRITAQNDSSKITLRVVDTPP